MPAQSSVQCAPQILKSDTDSMKIICHPRCAVNRVLLKQDPLVTPQGVTKIELREKQKNEDIDFC